MSLMMSESHTETNRAMTEALLMMERREQRDEALLRQALEWIEAQPEPRMIGSAKLITTLKERLK